jgi:hypothetical protein
MGTFADATGTQSDDDRYAPPKVITVDPSAFAHDWPGRPSEPVEVGLRIIPDADLDTARAEAARHAAAMHASDDVENAIDCFNDALLRHRIARTTCSPTDVRQPWLKAAEDMVRVALSSEGVKAISFEIDLFETENSPLYKPATDNEVADLVELLLQDEPFAGMEEARARRNRRLLAVVLEDIGAARAARQEAEDEDDPSADPGA